MCKICNGVGAIVYQKRDKNGDLVDFGAKCICPAGEKYKAWPSLEQVGLSPRFLAKSEKSA